MRNIWNAQFFRQMLILSAMLVNSSTFGQFYDSGQDRFRKLSIIKTEHFKVIFPSDQTRLGQLYANNLEHAYSNGGRTLNWRPRTISAVLFPSTSYANGEVAWAPRRMNLLTTASPDSYFQAWDRQLALHEFRHVVQSDKLNQGATHVFNILLGEQFTGLILGIHVPFWFLEGDAVAFETGSSTAGRGRTCDFDKQLTAQVAQKGIFSYSKAMFGSYADFIPSRYHLGYQLISYGRLNYGPGIWDNSINRVARHPIALRPFGRGIRQTSGLTENKFYKEALESLTSWPKNATPENAKLISSPKKRDYTNYYCPQRTFNGDIIAYRENLSDIPAFVAIDTVRNRQKVIARPGVTYICHFSTEKNLMAWNQNRFRRWDNVNYSQIVIYDIEKHKKSTILKKGRFYCSILSHNADKIASICVNDSSIWSITIHDTRGDLLKQYPTSPNVPVRIAWSDDDSEIAYIGNGTDSKSAYIININDNTARTIIGDIQDDISNLLFHDSHIYFTGNANGKAAWYQYDMTDSSCHIMAESPFGVGSGDIDGDRLLFTYYTADGYQIAEKNIDTSYAQAPLPTTYETVFTKALSDQEQLTAFGPDSTYETARYSRLGHLLNIHSWGPLAINVDNAEIGPGLTFMSQDVLSTSFLTAGYQYKYSESKDNYFAEYQYKGFFPIFSIRGDIDKFKMHAYDRNGISQTIGVTQKQLTASISVPMILKSSAFNTGMTIYTAYQHKVTSLRHGKFVRDTASNAVQYSIYAYTQRRLAHRDLQPRLGASFKADFMHNTNDISIRQTALQGNIYLPGLCRNHGLTVYCGLQFRNEDDLSFSNAIIFPRGCKTTLNKQMRCHMASYSLPLCYPDLCIGPALYIKRIKAKVFYDYAKIKKTGSNTDIQSAGCDLTADFHVYRIPVPISAGLRYARQISTEGNYCGLLFSMNFSSLTGNR